MMYGKTGAAMNGAKASAGRFELVSPLAQWPSHRNRKRPCVTHVRYVNAQVRGGLLRRLHQARRQEPTDNVRDRTAAMTGHIRPGGNQPPPVMAIPPGWGEH
jgi:hypothetical protein